MQAPVSSRGARAVRIAAAPRLAAESGNTRELATEPEPLDWLSPAARPSEKSSERLPTERSREEKTEPPKMEKTGALDDAADDVGGFAFDAGGGGGPARRRAESPGFGVSDSQGNRADAFAGGWNLPDGFR